MKVSRNKRISDQSLSDGEDAIDGGEKPELQRYRLVIEYDGSDFFGWQYQPDRRSVQGVLEEALKLLFDREIRICGAGRTDAGVHALGQVAHFDAPPKYRIKAIFNALNARLPKDVRVLSVAPAQPDFHARFGACWRWYRYRVFNYPRAVERAYGWYPGFKLDEPLLVNAAGLLAGDHDFTAFASSDSDTDDHRCRVYVAAWETTGGELRFHIVANRFLRHMVRSLVGAMVDVGRGRFPLDWLAALLQESQKTPVVFNVPGRGLCLMRVGYGPFPALGKDAEESESIPFPITRK